MAIKKFNAVAGFSVGQDDGIVSVVDNQGNVTAKNLTVGEVSNLGPASNVKITGGSSSYVLSTDGAGNLSWADPAGSGIAGSNTQIQFNNAGHFGTSANFTFNKASHSGGGLLNVGYGSNGEIKTDTVTANLIEGTLTTSAQPNITSVGTLTSLTVEGDTSITGNLKVQGSFDYINSTTTYISDPITEQGGGANGASLSSNDTKDRGALLHYYTTETVDAFMGWDNSNAEFAFGSNVSVTENVVTFNHLGNVRANVVIANLVGTLHTSAQPNITSVGNLTSLTVGNATTNVHIDAGNITALGITAHTGYFEGNLTVLGNLNAEVGGILYANSSIIYGNVDTGEGALYAGVPGYTPLPNTIVQFGANINNYSQFNFQNINDGNIASTDIVVTPDNGTDTDYYLAMGVAGSGWDGTQDNSLGDAVYADDGYLYVQGNVSSGDIGNLVIGTSVANTALKFIAGGTGSANIQATVDSNGFHVTNTLTSTNVHFTGSNVSLGNASNVKIGGGSNGFILQTDGSGNLEWVDNLPSTLTFNANSISLTNGVYVSGDITGIQSFGDYATGNVYVLTDGTGSAPAWHIDIDFLTVSSFNRVVLNINYTQASGHTIYIQLYNNVTSAWDSIGTYTGLGTYYGFALEVIDSTPYIDGSSAVLLRLYHSNSGNAGHTTSIDYVALELSSQGPQGPKGSTGATGATGPGVASGGTSGQVLIKNSSTNYDTAWSSNLSLSGNISAGNANLGNLVTANYYTGTLTTNAQPNITSVGTLVSLDITGNVTSGNANLGNLVTANYYTGTLTTNAQPNITSVGTLTSANITGNLNTGNANLGNLVTANYYTGTLTTNAQPNITSVGTLTSLAVTGAITSGDVTITGNLIVNGATEYANTVTFKVKDPIIEQGGNVDGVLTADDGKDRGQLLHYYTTEAVDAFMGWDNSNAEFAFGSNVSVSGDIVTFNEFATVRAGAFIGYSAEIETSISATSLTAITGSISETLSVGNLNAANVSADLATITAINATNANVTGNLTVDGNFTVNGTTTFLNSTTVNYVDPIIQLNGDPTGAPLTFNSGQDIGIGIQYFDTTAKSGFFGRKNNTGYFEFLVDTTETSGVVTGDYGTLKGLTYISTATTGTAPFVVNSTTRVANLNVATAGVAETVSNSAQPNITSVGTLTSANVTGNLKAGNANLGNLVSANFFSGNGSALTYLVGGNVVGQVANALIATTVTASSQPNITSVGTLTELTVNGATDLGPLRDLTISGGATGYYLSTNGAGDLTWAPGTSTGDAKFVSIVKRDYIADGTTFVYTLPTTPVTAESVSVNIDGLTQLADVYTVLGSEVHFASAPIAGQVIEFTVYGVVDIAGNDGEIYFSDTGQIGSDANLSYNKTTGELTANKFSGNGYHLTHINSANIVGGINSALSAMYADTSGTADTVTNPEQTNITKLGILTELEVSGDILPHENVTYNLGSDTKRWKDIYLSGHTIQLGDSSLTQVGDTLVLTNPIGGQFVVDGSNAAYASLASYVTEAAQSNITSVGTLTYLDISGDLNVNANITANGNVTVNGGYLTIDNSMIAVSSGNAGIFNIGVSNVSIGRTGNVILSQSGKMTDVKGQLHVSGELTSDSDISTTTTLNAGYVAASDGQFTGTLDANKIKVGDLYSSRLPISVDTDTVIDQFDPNTYRSAKYTIRVNSDDGYQAAEVLLIHDGADAYVTIYGSLSTIGLDIVNFRADITGGTVYLYATTNSSTPTTVNLLGTYVAD